MSNHSIVPHRVYRPLTFEGNGTYRALTMTGTVTCTRTDAQFQQLNPGGADRIMILTELQHCKGWFYVVKNTATVYNTISIQDEDSNVIGTIKPNESMTFLSDGIVWIASSGSVDHEAIDTLAHNLIETHYEEMTRDGDGIITNITAWEDNTKALKIRECTVTRTSGQVSSTVDVQYDSAGTAIETLTGTYTRTNGKVSSIEWSKA